MRFYTARDEKMDGGLANFDLLAIFVRRHVLATGFEKWNGSWRNRRSKLWSIIRIVVLSFVETERGRFSRYSSGRKVLEIKWFLVCLTWSWTSVELFK